MAAIGFWVPVRGGLRHGIASGFSADGDVLVTWDGDDHPVVLSESQGDTMTLSRDAGEPSEFLRLRDDALRAADALRDFRRDHRADLPALLRAAGEVIPGRDDVQCWKCGGTFAKGKAYGQDTDSGRAWMCGPCVVAEVTGEPEVPPRDA